ncbi:LOW QUALITY PROTEIN: adenylylsulfatase HINT3 [Arachis duranensis]|uniref:LOW QUALITY PROTEIN: adenylylsulfatase HINT3 n=1 Tax=Arachis duranensis TaxID=130453 RepID=A0A6P4D332_ARADU|nr:LOW QUALITY PROTEIN: adenylylsulfatase HINT3 [Arachis duranensis]
MDDSARKRLAILCSHLSPSPFSPDPTLTAVSGLVCAFSSSDAETQVAHTEKKNLQNDCIFCKIVHGKSPAWKLYEDDMCLCILDIYPLSHGHSLIIPKSHFPSLDATPPSVIAAMCSKVPFISNAIMKATGSDSFNLLINNGEAAGQVIFHTHIHIIPRKAYDCLWASESLRRRPLKLDDKVSQLAARIQEQLPSEVCQDSKNEDFRSSKS